MDPTIIALLGGLCIAGGMFAVVQFVGSLQGNKAEDRLDVLAGKKSAEEVKSLTREEFLSEGMSGLSAITESVMRRFENLKLLFEQADTKLKPESFVGLTILLAGGGLGAGVLLDLPVPVWPLLFLGLGVMPLMFLMWKRGRRMSKFGAQMPDALTTLSQALKSGHSLQSALSEVIVGAPQPIAGELRKVYEQSNTLGVPIDVALKDLYKRVPNMDFKFFATSVAVQKTAGGDLSEVIDKIAALIRERFRIQGQVKALTGEGRISGIVLMALPIGLFFTVYFLNPDYIVPLFTDTLGKQMMGIAIFLQLLGAVCIKKIVNIKI